MCDIYSQGIANDGPVILRDGLPMTPDTIVDELNGLKAEKDKEFKARKKCSKICAEYELEKSVLEAKIERLEEKNSEQYSENWKRYEYEKKLEAAHQEITDQKTFAISFKQKWLNSFEIAQKALKGKK